MASLFDSEVTLNWPLADSETMIKTRLYPWASVFVLVLALFAPRLTHATVMPS